MTKKSTPPPLFRVTHNYAHWPTPLLPLFEQAITCEYATLTSKAVPITLPLTPYIGEDEQTLDVSTGVTYPAKAERARSNPRVALLYADAVGSGLTKPPIALIYGYASVRDANLQANTDRYLQQSLTKSPAGFQGVPGFLFRFLPWYFVRIWIQVVPERILWWPEGNVDAPPQIWEAPATLQRPPSDPRPTGKHSPAWKPAPLAWRANAQHAVQNLGNPVLTTVDSAGYPVPILTRHTSLTNDGFLIDIPSGMPSINPGSACLTFQTHPQVFSTQENKIFLGHAHTAEPHKVQFVVERQLADWSLPGSRITAGLSFLESGLRLIPRLKTETARRNQPIPTIHVPDFW